MYDAIIVGSGIAGGSIARSLDGNVLVLEKNKKVLPKDSGIVSGRFLEHYGKEFIRHEITEMELVPPSGHAFFLRDDTPFAYILHRERFAEHTIKEAKKHADFRHESFISMKTFKDKAVVQTNKEEYECKMVVGCDGATSSVRKAAGIQPPTLSVGVMVKETGLPRGGIRAFFNKKYSPDFFSWIIPQNDEYGLMSGFSSNKCLEAFRTDNGLSEGKTYAYMIPTGMTRSYSDRCLLVGDACGQNKPLTGGGIVFSLAGARHASATIHSCLEKNRFDVKSLSAYEKSWRKDIGTEITKQLLVRRAYKRLGNDSIDKIFLDFGSHMEKLRGFDYDRFSASWRQMPKMKLMKFAISNLPSIF